MCDRNTRISECTFCFQTRKRYKKLTELPTCLPGRKGKSSTLSLVIQRCRQNDAVRIHRRCFVPHGRLHNCEYTVEGQWKIEWMHAENVVYRFAEAPVWCKQVFVFARYMSFANIVNLHKATVWAVWVGLDAFGIWTLWNHGKLRNVCNPVLRLPCLLYHATTDVLAAI